MYRGGDSWGGRWKNQTGFLLVSADQWLPIVMIGRPPVSCLSPSAAATFLGPSHEALDILPLPDFLQKLPLLFILVSINFHVHDFSNGVRHAYHADNFLLLRA